MTPQPSIPDDPVAAIQRVLESFPVIADNDQDVPELALLVRNRLRNDGYVLVNADMLAEALLMWEASADPEREDVGSYLGADIYANGAHTVAEALLAALKGPAR